MACDVDKLTIYELKSFRKEIGENWRNFIQRKLLALLWFELILLCHFNQDFVDFLRHSWLPIPHGVIKSNTQSFSIGRIIKLKLKKNSLIEIWNEIDQVVRYTEHLCNTRFISHKKHQILFQIVVQREINPKKKNTPRVFVSK